MFSPCMKRTKITKRFVRDEAAVAAVEFAVALPFLLVLLLGAIDVTYGVSASRKVVLAANTTSDLVAQVKTVDDGYLENTFLAASAVIKPFDDSRMKVVISSVVVDKNGLAAVAWSKSNNKLKAPRGKGEIYLLEEDLKAPKSSLVVAEVEYEYVPVIGHIFKENWAMAEKIYARPRVATADEGVLCSAPGC